MDANIIGSEVVTPERRFVDPEPRSKEEEGSSVSTPLGLAPPTTHSLLTESPLRQKSPPVSVERALSFDDMHPSLSPPGAAEALFMGRSLSSSYISAAALAQQIHQNHSPFFAASVNSGSRASIATDDFHTTYSTASQLSLVQHAEDLAHLASSSSPVPASNNHLTPSLLPRISLEEDDSTVNDDDTNVFDKDPLARNLDTTAIAPEDHHNFHDTRTMTDSTSNNAAANLSPAEKTYDVVKGIWGWGKGVIVFSPFLGLAEGVAGKVVDMAGSSLEEVDGNVTERLHGIDDGVLNPAIAAIVEALLGAAHSTEDFIKPVVLTLLKPIDFLIKSGPEEDPEVTTTPTYATVASVDTPTRS